MIRYHFTSAHHYKKVREKGLTHGVIPWNVTRAGRLVTVPHWQWLTEDPDWAQSWDSPGFHSKLPFRRTEYRITIEIPGLYDHRCIRWEVWKLRMKMSAEACEYYSHFAGQRFWWVYHGKIPRAWFIEVRRNPELVQIDEEFLAGS